MHVNGEPYVDLIVAHHVKDQEFELPAGAFSIYDSWGFRDIEIYVNPSSRLVQRMVVYPNKKEAVTLGSDSPYLERVQTCPLADEPRAAIWMRSTNCWVDETILLRSIEIKYVDLEGTPTVCNPHARALPVPPLTDVSFQLVLIFVLVVALTVGLTLW